MISARERILREIEPVSNIWKLALSTRSYKINIYNAWTVILLSTCVAVYGFYIFDDSAILSGIGSNISSLSFNFSATILGFLIAGFTIFATLSDKELFVFMASRHNSQYKVTYLRYTFNVFMDVFLQYILLLIISLIATFIFTVISKDPAINQFDKVLGFLVYYFVSSFLMICISSLISFIYNIYATIMLSLIWFTNTLSDAKLDALVQNDD